MLRPIDPTCIAAAIALLTIGFPKASALFWQQGLERLRALGGNREAGVPIGHLLMDDDKPVGVILTPASVRAMPDGTEKRVVNLSSWYIDPAHRWRAPVMLRAVTRDRDALYTDLTPSLEVQKMLPAFGFKPINRGFKRHFTPVAALARRALATVRDLAKAPAGAIHEPTRQMLESHRGFACLPCALHADGTWHPLMFKSRRVRGLPAAELVYCEDNTAMTGHLSAVARYLIRRRKLFLIIEDRAIDLTDVALDPKNGIRFAKGGLQPNRTDYAGSEICILGV